MMEADGKNVTTIQTDISGDTFDNLLTNESVSIVTHIKNTWMVRRVKFGWKIIG